MNFYVDCFLNDLTVSELFLCHLLLLDCDMKWMLQNNNWAFPLNAYSCMLISSNGEKLSFDRVYDLIRNLQFLL